MTNEKPEIKAVLEQKASHNPGSLTIEDCMKRILFLERKLDENGIHYHQEKEGVE